MLADLKVGSLHVSVSTHLDPSFPQNSQCLENKLFQETNYPVLTVSPWDAQNTHSFCLSLSSQLKNSLQYSFQRPLLEGGPLPGYHGHVSITFDLFE